MATVTVGAIATVTTIRPDRVADLARTGRIRRDRVAGRAPRPIDGAMATTIAGAIATVGVIVTGGVTVTVIGTIVTAGVM
jgi:hypothetical protein